MECDIFEAVGPYHETATTSASPKEVVSSVMDNELQVVLFGETKCLLDILRGTCVDSNGGNRALFTRFSTGGIEGAFRYGVVREDKGVEVVVLHYSGNVRAPKTFGEVVPDVLTRVGGVSAAITRERDGFWVHQRLRELRLKSIESLLRWPTSLSVEALAARRKPSSSKQGRRE